MAQTDPPHLFLAPPAMPRSAPPARPIWRHCAGARTGKKTNDNNALVDGPNGLSTSIPNSPPDVRAGWLPPKLVGADKLPLSPPTPESPPPRVFGTCPAKP